MTSCSDPSGMISGSRLVKILNEQVSFDELGELLDGELQLLEELLTEWLERAQTEREARTGSAGRFPTVPR